MSERQGSVWYERRLVGELEQATGGRMSFRYDSAWLRDGFPISLSLPMSEGNREQDGQAFFAGLLPEGLTRQRVCRQYRLRDDDDMALLLAIGRDCAGALSVLPADAALDVEQEPVPIDEEALDRLVDSRGQALPVGTASQRFSLAGAQDKVAVRIERDAMWLPDRDHPSTHILKFETTRWVCFAEYAGSQLARRVGLPVVGAEYREHGLPQPTPYLRVERYDRIRDGEHGIRRLHQEDVVQAMGLDGSAKYQEQGGPDLSAVATLLRRHSSDPVADIAALRDWQLFNYLAGNSDGHAKNLALVYPLKGSVPRLAPFYDLVCIEFLNRIGIRYDRKLAFFVGERSIPEEITRRDWVAHSASIGVPAKGLLERLERMAQELPGHATETRVGFAEHFGDNPVYDRFEECIADRCSWALRCVFGRG